MPKIIPVILCGGSGSRLWPLSRVDIPKQFLKLLDNNTLLQKTILRTIDIIGEESPELVIVTLNSMKAETIRQMQEVPKRFKQHILGEPQARNTAAAVAYAATYVQEKFGADAIMWILPSDHYVGDENALSDALNKAIKSAEEGYLVTFGIEPTRPETGYGYIRKAARIDESGAFKVAQFIEKPPLEVALAYIQTGEYLWSSGMHVFKVSTVIANYERHAPDILNMVQLSVLEGVQGQPSPLTYGFVDETPFEAAVMERAEKIAVIPCDPQWSDIGCWESLWEIKHKNESGNALKGRVVCEETNNSMILAQNRLVTCVGLNNVIIIETADSILVADKRSNSSLKKLVKALQTSGHKEIMSPAAPQQVAASVL